jgi:UDP-glucose 4-epimerase/dTDP-L-rhamnose 4-epimerase
VLVHLAGLKSAAACAGNVAGAIDSNVTLTRVLMEEARSARVTRVLFASSYWVYGRRLPGEPPCREGDELRPVDVYGMSKALAEQIVLESGLDFLVLRLSNVFGVSAHEVNNDVVFHMVRSALERSTIDIDGAGDQTIDLIAVDVVCDHVRRLAELESRQPETVNVGSGRAVSIADLASIVARISSQVLRRQVTVRHRAAAAVAPFSKALSIDRLRRLLQPFEEASLEAMLTRFVQQQAASALQ